MFLAIFQTEKAKNRFHAAIILRRQNGGRSAAGHMTNKMAAPTIRGWDLSIPIEFNQYAAAINSSNLLVDGYKECSTQIDYDGI